MYSLEMSGNSSRHQREGSCDSSLCLFGGRFQVFGSLGPVAMHLRHFWDHVSASTSAVASHQSSTPHSQISSAKCCGCDGQVSTWGHLRLDHPDFSFASAAMWQRTTKLRCTRQWTWSRWCVNVEDRHLSIMRWNERFCKLWPMPALLLAHWCQTDSLKGSIMSGTLDTCNYWCIINYDMVHTLHLLRFLLYSLRFIHIY